MFDPTVLSVQESFFHAAEKKGSSPASLVEAPAAAASFAVPYNLLGAV
jgi:hypothetical protein